MFLKDYLQYEKQKRRENQRIRKAGKQRSWKSRKAKKQRSKEETEIKKTSAQNGELCHLRVPAVADVAPWAAFWLPAASPPGNHGKNWGKSKGVKKSWETIIGSNFLEHEHPHSLSWFYSHRNLLKSSLSLSHGITRLVQKGDSPNRRIRSGAGYTPLHVQIHQCHTISYHIIIS